jgi:hypothetical protein
MTSHEITAGNLVGKHSILLAADSRTPQKLYHILEVETVANEPDHAVEFSGYLVIVNGVERYRATLDMAIDCYNKNGRDV